jgi:hypothetical protein
MYWKKNNFLMPYLGYIIINRTYYWTLTYSVDCFALNLIFTLFHMCNVGPNLLLVYMTEERLTHFWNYNEQILEGIK